MDLIYRKKYPEYDSYRGVAYVPKIDFSTLRTGLPPIDDMARAVTEQAIEFWVWTKGGRMLETLIWREDSSWQGVPTYTWRAEFRFYLPGEAAVIPAAVPAIVIAIIEAIISALPIILIGLVIWINLHAINMIIHGGPAGQAFAVLIGIGIAAAGVGYLLSKTGILKKEERKISFKELGIPTL